MAISLKTNFLSEKCESRIGFSQYAGRNPKVSFDWFDLECPYICGEGKVETK